MPGWRTVDWSPQSTWSAPARLTEGQFWHQAPCNVRYANGCVYLVMERRTRFEVRGWYVGEMAPVLMRGRLGDDLTRRESWVFASELTFRDVMTEDRPDWFGVPFFAADPIHGVMVTQLEKAPSGKTMLYVPCPGGQMKFHVLYDEESRLCWLLSTQATDSMIRPDRMPHDRYNLPNNERRRMQLHFSKNMIDWCFAGLVAVGPVEKASRHYASMAIDGDDLVVLSRSGDERAKSAHDGNIITFHRVKDFRGLVY